jgi:hypothetical protein
LPQALSDKATLTASAMGFKYGLVMDVPLWVVGSDDRAGSRRFPASRE